MSNENYDNNQYESETGFQENPQMQEDNGYFYSSSSELQPKPKKKKWPVAVGIIGAAAVIGGGCVFAFSHSPAHKNPDDAVISCISQLDKQFSAKKLNSGQLSKKLDPKGMAEALMEEGQYMDLSLTLEDSDMDELAMLSGVTVGFSYQKDVPNTRSTFGLNASVMGIGGDIGLYMDDKMMALTSDEFLPDTYLSAKYKDLIALSAEEMSEEEFNYLIGMLNQSSELSTAMYDYLDYAAAELSDSLKGFIKDCEIDKPEKNTLKIGSDKYDCYSYEIGITAAAFKGFLEDYGTYLADYDYNNNLYFSSIAKSAALEGEEIDINEAIHESVDTLTDAIDEEDDETIDFLLHIDKKGRLLGLDFEIDAEEIDNGTIEVRFGGENPGQNLSFRMAAADDYTNFVLDVLYATDYKDKNECSTFEINMSLYGENVFSLQSENNYNSEDDSFDSTINMDMNIDDESISASITANGAYTEIEKSQGYTAKFDELTIKLDSDIEDVEIPFSEISLSGEISHGILQEEIKQPSGTEYNLLNLTEEDTAALLEILKKNELLSTILQTLPEDELQQFMDNALSSIA